VTPHLSASLLCPGQGAERFESFLPGGVLRRYRLVTFEDGGPLASRAVRMDDRITQYLLGSDHLDQRVAALLEPPEPEAGTAEWNELAGRIAQALVGPPRWRALHLAGPPDSGQKCIAAAVCERFGLNLRVVDVARLRASGLREWTPLLEREAILASTVYYFELDRAEERELFTRELESLAVFHVTASPDRARGKALTVTVTPPGAPLQAAMWSQGLLDGEVSPETIDAIVEQFHFGPERIRHSLETAWQLAILRTGSEAAALTDDDLWRACRAQSGGELAQLAQRIVPCHDWDDLILPEDAGRQLEELAAQVAHRALVYESWGFGQKLNRGRGVAALFAGPSGTGKTLAAEVLAAHLKLDLFRIDLAAVVSKFIGETEKNLRCVFDAAERCGAVLFFDEADALFARRSEVKDSHDRYANLEVNYLLQRMEDYRGLAVLASNRKDVIDEAFMRRLRFIVDFPFPDSRQRARIWQGVFPKEAPSEGLDFAALARLEIPGGSIRNIALNAAFRAAEEGGPVTMRHVMGAAGREYRKIGKLMREAEFGRYYTEAAE
jgi:hypothetical protein